MKSRTLVNIWSWTEIIVGIFALLGTILRLGNLELPYHQLPGSFKAVFILSLSIMGLSSLIFVLWAILLFIRSDWSTAFQNAILDFIKRPRTRLVLIFLMLMLSLISAQILLQSDTSGNVLGILFVEITEVFFIWMFLTSFLSLVILLADKEYLQWIMIPDNIRPTILMVIIMALLAALNGSKYGFNRFATASVEGDFRLTGFPVLDYQVLISWMAVFGGLFLIHWIINKWGKGKKVSTILVDLIVVFGLFVSTFLITKSSPIVPNAFIDRPRPPNFTVSPNLDAEIYERTAQSLLATGELQTYIGEGDYLTLARRPLFTGYLALLHWLGGLAYEDILPYQLLLFSIIPVLVYLFTKTLHNRISGLLTAILLIIRNQNGLLLAGDVWGGNTLQMLMSDFPAMIFAILFMLLFVLWIKASRENPLIPLIMGGVIGLGMLIRQEIAFLIPAVGLVAVTKYKKRLKQLSIGVFLIFIGIVVVITPWISRNWVKTGKIYLDKPGNRIERIIHTFSTLGDESEIPAPIGHSEEPAVEIMPSDPAHEEALKPLDLLINHYANAVPQLFLYLPSNPLMLNFDYMWKFVNREVGEYYGDILYSPYKYAKSLPYWWFDQWDGKIDQKSWIYLTGVVGLISLGIYQVWKKESWITFVPLLATIGMISIYAINRESGGRWLQTVDWFSAMFLCIGLVEISTRALTYLRENSKKADPVPILAIFREERFSLPSNMLLVSIFLGMLLLGTLPIIAEILIPNHYPESEMEIRLSSVLDDENPSITHDDRVLLHNFLAQGGEVIYGRALYPRYFPPNASMMTTNQRLFPSSTTFTIAGTELNFIVLPSIESPASFPHGSDVLVFGCRETSFPPDPRFPCLGCRTPGFDALAVIRLSGEDQVEDVYWRYGDYGDFVGCPLKWPGE